MSAENDCTLEEDGHNAECGFDLGRLLAIMKASNQKPENKRPIIRQMTAVLSMNRVVRVEITQWENIIKGLSAPYPHLATFKSRNT